MNVVHSSGPFAHGTYDKIIEESNQIRSVTCHWQARIRQGWLKAAAKEPQEVVYKMLYSPSLA